MAEAAKIVDSPSPLFSARLYGSRSEPNKKRVEELKSE